jgi:hypothetical protein
MAAPQLDMVLAALQGGQAPARRRALARQAAPAAANAPAPDDRVAMHAVFSAALDAGLGCAVAVRVCLPEAGVGWGG